MEKYKLSMSNLKNMVFNKVHNQKIANEKNKYCFINNPKLVDKTNYYVLIDRIVKLLKKRDGIISIYLLGSIKYPGISDLDFLIIFKERTHIHYNPMNDLSKKEKYLFTHNMTGITESQLMESIDKYFFWHDIKHLWGKKINFREKKLNKLELNAVKKQTALEFLIKNHIDLSIQLKYKVINLRSTLQQIKAIKFDLEFLDQKSSRLNQLLFELNEWMEDWFKHPSNHVHFGEWIEKFHCENRKLIEFYLKKIEFFVPEWANLKYTRNISIKNSEFMDFEFSGFSFPRKIIAINKKSFNLNNRFNSFVISFPFTTVAKYKILEERYKYFRELKEYAADYYPHFSPLITSFAYRIV